MELVFHFIYVSLILVKVIYGEDNSCGVFKNGPCIHTIHARFSSDVKTVTILHEDLSGKTEQIAVCDWIGDHFSCDTKTGITYHALSRTEISFIVESGVPCLNGKFTLGANGHGEFPCVEKSDKREDNSCGVFRTEPCIQTIDARFSSDVKTVTILHEDLSGKTEQIAVCDWIGDHFSCDTKTGISYNASSRTEISFRAESGVLCLNGKFTLGANGHGTFPCVEKSDKSELEHSESESNTDNDERTPTHNPPQTDDRESSSLLPFVIIIPVIISVAIIAVAILVIVKRERMAFKKQIPTQSEESLMKKPEQPQV